MSDGSQSPGAASNASSQGGAIDDEELKDLVSDGEDGSPRNSKHANGASDNEMGDEDEDAGGLFGSGSEDDEGSTTKRRKLSDAELDSGDDENRHDRALSDDAPEQDVEERELSTVAVKLGRHAVPKGSDGELYLLRNPNVVGVEPKAFSIRSFAAPTTGHNAKAPISSFSPSQTANTTVRWKRSVDNPATLQSNSRILRWSDGSLTLQIGSNAMEQLQLPGKSLAPVQRNPVKPTPTSINNAKGPAPPYDARQDSHTYLASIHHDQQFVQVTNHVTTSLTIQSTVEENDDALIRLQENMAAAIKARNNKGGDVEGPVHIRVTEDPELAKRKAEIAEREKLRADKRRQTQEQKQRERTGGVARFGGRSAVGSGLTVGGLEDEGGPSRPRAKPARKPKRRNSEYSEDEDDYRKGKSKEDEYDEDDGFLVGDEEEEPELVSDDGEEEDILDDDEDAEGEVDVQVKPARSPKRSREGEEDAAATAGRRRRKIVDDDDDDE